MIRDIYDLMHARGLVASEREFSTVWLGRAANYACDTRLDCSAETAMRLANKLTRAGHRDLAGRAIVAVLRKQEEARVAAAAAAAQQRS